MHAARVSRRGPNVVSRKRERHSKSLGAESATNKPAGDDTAATPETNPEDGGSSQEKGKTSEPQRHPDNEHAVIDSSESSDETDTPPHLPLNSDTGKAVPQSSQIGSEIRVQSHNNGAFVSESSHSLGEGHDEEPSQSSEGPDKGDKEDGEDNSSSSDYEKDGPLRKSRLAVGSFVNHAYFQIFIIVLILVNALFMGIATFDFVTDNPDVDKAFAQVDQVFLIIFTIEIAMQLYYLGLPLFLDGWLAFDFLIVVMSWSFESLQIVRAFRIFRAFRLITRVKPLRDLVLAIGAVLPRMYAIGALLLLVFYIFSVLFTELFKDLPLSTGYFATLDASLFTCLEMMTLEWADITREVMSHRSWAWAPFLAFIMITGFIVFNLIVAVVCDAVAVTEQTVRELEGEEEDNTERRLEEAQERIDHLQAHINEMLRTQQHVQEMLELMAGELLHLETERKKSHEREIEMRLELERRMEYEREMEKQRKNEFLARQSIRMERSLSASAHGSSRHVRRRSFNSQQGSISDDSSTGSMAFPLTPGNLRSSSNKPTGDSLSTTPRTGRKFLMGRSRSGRKLNLGGSASSLFSSSREDSAVFESSTRSLTADSKNSSQ